MACESVWEWSHVVPRMRGSARERVGGVCDDVREGGV